MKIAQESQDSEFFSLNFENFIFRLYIFNANKIYIIRISNTSIYILLAINFDRIHVQVLYVYIYIRLYDFHRSNYRVKPNNKHTVEYKMKTF